MNERTLRRLGAQKLGEWLHYCLSIGWSKSSLHRLQEIWMQYHDDDGNLTVSDKS